MKSLFLKETGINFFSAADPSLVTRFNAFGLREVHIVIDYDFVTETTAVWFSTCGVVAA